MPEILGEIVFTALLAAFVVLVFSKTGARYEVRDWCDRNGLCKVADMLDCDFCFGFWTCVFTALCLSVLGVLPLSGYVALIPLCAAPITRFLL